MTIIALDGVLYEPKVADYINVNIGERYRMVVCMCVMCVCMYGSVCVCNVCVCDVCV